MEKFLQDYAARVRGCLERLPWRELERLVEVLARAIREGRRIFVFGNGACAAASSHFACDLAKGLAGEGIPRVKAMCLNDCVPLMTAWSNDVGYEVVFKEQLVNYLEPGDVVIGLSASGNSPNVVNAVEYAVQAGGVAVALVGMGGGKLASLAKHVINISQDSYEEVEDVIVVVTHMLKMALKRRLKPESPAG
jgi:D-sedoheptulose 7-phosphate isomerase